MFFRNLCLILSGFFFSFSSTYSQTNYLRVKEATFLNVEYNLPLYKKYPFGVKTGFSLNLNAKLKVNKNLSVLLEVPYAKGGNDFWGEPFSKSESDATWGNPLIGFEIKKTDSDLLYEFGLRLPGTDKNSWRAISTGSGIDQGRAGAFSSEAITLYGLLDYQPELSKNIYLLVNGGPMLYLSKNFGVPQVSLAFSNRIGWQNDLLDIASGFGMMVYLSGGSASLGERTFIQFEFSASVNFANFIPGIVFRLPVSGESAANGVIGFNLGYLFH
jgi:hypothetical protein